MKKILVGSPVNEMYEYCIKEYTDAITSLSYKNYDILLVDNSKTDAFYKKLKSMKIKVIRGKYFEEPRDRMIDGRNILREKAINENYDFFMNIDQDVIPPRDIIERFLQHKKRVITGIYFNYRKFTPRKLGSKEGERYGGLFPTVWRFTNKKDVIRQLREDELTGQLVQIASSGSGCLFIHNSVLKKINFHYSKDNDKPEKNYFVFDDAYFCKDLMELKIPVYADTSMICRHLIKEKGWTWSDYYSKNQNRKQNNNI
ncbi:glycosyltransferase family 2 protein [Candidatus Woesearchaeota archaeon]|nr:glycosyltransferase family 2 protein [Candidatus Woesearchaeota archaeon]